MLMLFERRQFKCNHLFLLLLFLNIITDALPGSMTTAAPQFLNSTTAWTTESGFPAGYFVNIYIIVIMSSFALVLNAILLVVFTVDPLRCLRSISSSLIINLALADLVTATTILIWATGIWHWQPPLLFNVVFSLIWFGYTASFLTITLLSCERFIAIKYIWSAERIVTKQRTMYAIITIWLLSSLAFINMSPNYISCYIMSLSIVFELCVLVVIIFYYKLWKIRRKHNLRENPIAVKEGMKLTKVVFLLSIILVITTLPLMTIYQIIFLVERICEKEFCLGKTFYALPLQFFPVFTLNFGLNPVIYAWRLPKYRRSFYQLCSMLFKNITGQRSKSSENREVGHCSMIALREFTSPSCVAINQEQ